MLADRRYAGVDDMRACGREDSGALPVGPVSRYDYAKEFLAFMRQGEKAGLVKYGPFNPATDTRTLTVEAQEECRDIGVYMAFLSRKFPELHEETIAVRQIALKLYIALRQLESRERGLSATSGEIASA